MTGLGLAYALLAALTAARATGRGRDIDVSLFDMALNCTNYLAAWYLNRADAQTRLPRSAHPSLTPCQLYRTADGWLFIMCNKEKFWPLLCDELGRPQWAEEPKYRDFKNRLSHREELTGLLDEALMTQSTRTWLQRFAGRVPAAPINNIAEALENPFVTEHGRVQTLEHPKHGTYRLVAPPVIDGESEPPAQPAPALGEHTDEILAGAGYDANDIAELRKQGVI
jgi:crotonobetainyl-CoA:carnitine CoA-transferase CaiB-like acyl-CoA transferase